MPSRDRAHCPEPERADRFVAEVTPAHRAADIVQRLDDWLRSDTDWTIADEYPLVFGPSGRARLVTLRSGAELVAHAAMLDVDVVIDGLPVAVTMLGSVVVHPERRGQGIGASLIDEVLMRFHASGRDVLLLWSDKSDFYARFGFRPIGAELAVTLEAAPASPQARPFQDSDLESLVRLHEQKPVRIPRSVEDFRQLLSIPETRTTVLEEDGRVTAYACVGKGLDCAGIVHETGGSDSALLHLLPSLDASHALLPAWRLAIAPFLGPVTPRSLGLGISDGELPEDFYVEGLDSI